MPFIFSDLNAISPTIKPLLGDVEAVYQSLYNILGTRQGERLFEIDFGVVLEDYLFELMDDITELSLLQSVLNAVARFEPRLTVDNSRTIITAIQLEKRYELDLYFSINGLDESFQLQGSFTQ